MLVTMCPPAPLSPSVIDFKADDMSILKHLRDIENGLPLPANVIPELNPCTVAPWDLPEKVFYLITRKEQGVPRVIDDGYWEASGAIPIGFASSSTVGWKTTLVFYIGRRPNAYRIGWVMHEYRMEERGSYLLYRMFFRDADADGAAVDSNSMRVLQPEESNTNLLGSINRSQVMGGRNQHGQSGVSSNSLQNVRVDLFRHGPRSQEDHREEFHYSPQDLYMELDDLQASSSSAENSFFASFNSEDSFVLDAMLHDLQSQETTRDVSSSRLQHSNPRLSVPASINLDVSFMQRELAATREVSNSRQQHSNHQLDVSASINSDDGFDAEALLRVLHEGVRSDVPNRRQQQPNPRFNLPASINLNESFNSEVFQPEVGASREVSNSRQQHSNQELNASASIDSDDGFNPVTLLRELGSSEGTSGESRSGFNVSGFISSEDGFDPVALMDELGPEETSMDASNRDQQHSNSRFNASAPTDSDVGYVPDALLCQLQSGEMSRGVSGKGQQHVNRKFNISACQGSQQMVMNPPLSGSLRGGSSNNLPAKEIISSATRPTEMIKVRGASIPNSSSLRPPPHSVLGSDIGIIQSHLQRASQGPSIRQDGGSHRGQGGRKSSPGGMAKLRQMFCCFMPK